MWATLQNLLLKCGFSLKQIIARDVIFGIWEIFYPYDAVQKIMLILEYQI